MSDAILRAMPRDRMLTETDFPARQVRARMPGKTDPIESRLAQVWGISEEESRHQLWVNLKRLAIDSGAINAVSDSLADYLLTV